MMELFAIALFAMEYSDFVARIWVVVLVAWLYLFFTTVT